MRNSAIQSFVDGKLSVNEFTVLVAVQAQSDMGYLETSTTAISNSLNGDLSRHAVARALRKLQRNKYLDWETKGSGRRNSTIVVY